MRIAIFQDYFENIGGGEKLVLSLAKNLDATIITTNIDKKVLRDLKIKGIKFIDLGNTNKHFFLKHISIVLKFSLCNFSKQFDYFIFSGNRSIFASKKHKPNLWICYNPERAVFDLYDFYKKNLAFVDRIIFTISVYFFRIAYLNFAVKNIQNIVSISEIIQKKVKKYLKKKTKIIYPGIETQKYKYNPPKDYWLSVNRIYPQKRIELQLETFKKVPNENLIVVGNYVKGDLSEVYWNNLNKSAPNNVNFKGGVSEKELLKLYSNCKGFITTPIGEDFGLTAIEAMASGKAVVAVNEGGYVETVIDGKTGYLSKPIPQELANAVKKISKKPQKYNVNCILQAKKFDEKFFNEKIKEEINARPN